MILLLFLILFMISVLIISLAVIFSKQWGGMGLVGFTFMFLLSMIILQGNLEYPIGTNMTTSFTYAGDGSILSASQSATDNFLNWSDSTSHMVGYFLAISSFVGFAATLLNLKGNWRKPND